VVATALASCLIAGIIAVVGGMEAPQIAAAAPTEQVVFHVNSAEFGVADADVDDGVCDTGTMITLNGTPRPRCTLRAAIEQANAVSVALGATTGEEVLVTLDPDFAGGTIQGVEPAAGAYMSTSALTDLGGAPTWFVVKAPMTIDLKDSLKTSGKLASSVFAITGANVTITRASGILGGDTSFVVTGSASGVTIDSGTTYQTGTNFAKRFLVINNGARDVTFSSYKVGSLAASASNGSDTNAAVVFTPGGQPNAVTTNVVIDAVDFTSPWTALLSAQNCSDSSSIGCVNTGVIMAKDSRVDGFEMRKSAMRNLYSPPGGSYANVILNAARLSPGALANVSIHDNTFVKNFTWEPAWVYGALILLPDNVRLQGSNVIRDNVFDNSGQTSPAQSYAIAWTFTSNATTNPSGLSITGNHFDGFARAGILLRNAGLVTVARNTFGPKSASANPDSSEPSAVEPAMLSNGGTTNGGTMPSGVQQKILPWAPTKMTVSSTCAIEITAARAGSTAYPPTPVALDVYWTTDRWAEVYMGSTPMTITGTSTTMTMALPAQAVKAGVASGRIRIQTHTDANGTYGQALSTQYSYTVAVPTSSCAPPAVMATQISRTHGAAAGGGLLTIRGKDFDYDTPHVSFQSGEHAAPCTDLTVISPTEATCVIPKSPVPGDGAGVVDVVVTAGGKPAGAFPQAYTYSVSALTRVTPDHSPIGGAEECSAFGSGMVTLIDGVRFPGGSWIDTTITQANGMELWLDAQLDAGNGASKTILGAGRPNMQNSLSVAVTGSAPALLQGTGPGMAQLASPYDTKRHTIAFQSGQWFYDGIARQTTNVGSLSAVNIYLGAANTGDSVLTATTTFSGVVYGLRLWKSASLAQDLHPAAWTVAGETVYGFLDQVTGRVFTAPGLMGTDNMGRPLTVEATAVYYGDQVEEATVTVASDARMDYVCPPSKVARVDVWAVIDSVATAPLAGGHLYWVDGDFTIVTRAWTNAEGLDHEQIVGTLDNSGAKEVGRLAIVRFGTTLWWTHTVTYAHIDPETGVEAGTGQDGLTDVEVWDEELDTLICALDEVRVNVPTGCVTTSGTLMSTAKA